MRINYILALIFGLVHGMGFANSARMMLSSEEHIAIPLLGFNIGLEVGQILVVIICLSIVYAISKFLKFRKKYWIVGISVIAIFLSLKMILEKI